MRMRVAFAVLALLSAVTRSLAAPLPNEAAPSFIAYLHGPMPALVAFNPSAYDPGQAEARVTPLAEIRADLRALRPVFDGLVLYAYEPSLTPQLVEAAVAEDYRAIVLGIWNPRDPAEIDGTAALIRRHVARIAFAVCIGNEGINDNRYAIDDVRAAADRLRSLLPPDLVVPLTTSEPSGDYGWPPLRGFGDFLAPNIHPALDRPGLLPDAAARWARRRAEAVALTTGRPVLVKETGWPNGGTPGFTAEDQAAFWRAWLETGRLVHLGEPPTWVSYAAAFEAFDAPWKAKAMASAIEGRWGLLDHERRPHPAFEVWTERAGR